MDKALLNRLEKLEFSSAKCNENFPALIFTLNNNEKEYHILNYKKLNFGEDIAFSNLNSLLQYFEIDNFVNVRLTLPDLVKIENRTLHFKNIAFAIREE